MFPNKCHTDKKPTKATTFTVLNDLTRLSPVSHYKKNATAFIHKWHITPTPLVSDITRENFATED